MFLRKSTNHGSIFGHTILDGDKHIDICRTCMRAKPLCGDEFVFDSLHLPASWDYGVVYGGGYSYTYSNSRLEEPLRISLDSSFPTIAKVSPFYGKAEDVYHLLRNGRPLCHRAVARSSSVGFSPPYRTATITELGSDDSEVESEVTEVTLNFVYYSEQRRRRIFPLKVEKSQTVMSITEELENALERTWPPIPTTNKNMYITDGWTVLSDNSYPARGAKNGKSLVIHIVPADETCVPMKLEVDSQSEEVENLPGMVFVSENTTIADLREKISRMFSYHRASITIYVDAACQNDDVEKEEEEEDEELEEWENDCERDAGSECSSSTRSFEPLALSSDALIKDHPQIFYSDCLLKIKHEAPLTLKVKVKIDAGREVSEFSLQMYQNETVETVRQAVAKEMGTDVRRVKLRQKPDKTIRSCGWGKGRVVKAKLLTKAAEVLIAHSLFEYPYFAEDVTKMTVGEIERMVENKHSFRPKCVRLYLQNRLLKSDLTLKCAGIGVGSRLTVRINPHDSTGRKAGNQKHAKMKEPQKSEDRSADTSSEACQRTETRSLKRSTAAESDVGSTASKKRRNLPPSTARVHESRKTASATLQNAQSTSVGGDSELCEDTQSSVVAITSSVAGVSGSQNAASSQSAIQVLEGQGRNQIQDIRGLLSTQSQLTCSQDNYEHHVGIMARAFCTWLLSSNQVPLPPGPASFLASQVVEDKLLRQIAEGLEHEWISLCLELDVASADLARIKQKHEDLLEQGYEGLRRWKMTKGSQATKEALERALRAKNLNLLADKIGV